MFNKNIRDICCVPCKKSIGNLRVSESKEFGIDKKVINNY